MCSCLKLTALLALCDVVDLVQPVHNAAGVAMAQPISNSHSWGPQAANSMEAVQHYAALAAKTSGKHIKNVGEASYKYLSSQVDFAHVLRPSCLSSSSAQGLRSLHDALTWVAGRELAERIRAGSEQPLVHIDTATGRLGDCRDRDRARHG